MTRLSTVAARVVATPSSVDSAALAVGESSVSRIIAAGSLQPASGQLRLSYFTARKTETVTSVRINTFTAGAAPTPTLCRVGIYSEDASGTLTLVGSTANDTTLFATAITAYTRSLTTSFKKTSGQRYALGILVVSAAAMPAFPAAVFSASPEMAISPRLAGQVTGLADLPASVAAGSLGLSGAVVYGVLLP